MPRDLGAVAAGAHVAPSTAPGGRLVDEEPAARVVGADAQAMRVVVGEVVGERPGDGGASLLQLVADRLHAEVAIAIGRAQGVVVEAVAHHSD